MYINKQKSIENQSETKKARNRTNLRIEGEEEEINKKR